MKIVYKRNIIKKTDVNAILLIEKSNNKKLYDINWSAFSKKKKKIIITLMFV